MKTGITSDDFGDVIHNQVCYHDHEEMCHACVDPENGDETFCAGLPRLYEHCKTTWSESELQHLDWYIAEFKEFVRSCNEAE